MRFAPFILLLMFGLPFAKADTPKYFRITVNYFVDERGFAKPTCKMPGPGPTWINGLVSLPDAAGRKRMLAMYVKVKKPILQPQAASDVQPTRWPICLLRGYLHDDLFRQ